MGFCLDLLEVFIYGLLLLLVVLFVVLILGVVFTAADSHQHLRP